MTLLESARLIRTRYGVNDVDAALLAIVVHAFYALTPSARAIWRDR